MFAPFSCEVSERNDSAIFMSRSYIAENTGNNEGNLNYQSSQLEKEDLQKLEADSVSVSTKIRVW